jgi:hypothetical protein
VMASASQSNNSRSRCRPRAFNPCPSFQLFADPVIYRTSPATLRFASRFQRRKISRHRQNLFHSRVHPPPLQGKKRVSPLSSAPRAPFSLPRAPEGRRASPPRAARPLRRAPRAASERRRRPRGGDDTFSGRRRAAGDGATRRQSPRERRDDARLTWRRAEPARPHCQTASPRVLAALRARRRRRGAASGRSRTQLGGAPVVTCAPSATRAHRRGAPKRPPSAHFSLAFNRRASKVTKEFSLRLAAAW